MKKLLKTLLVSFMLATSVVGLALTGCVTPDNGGPSTGEGGGGGTGNVSYEIKLTSQGGTAIQGATVSAYKGTSVVVQATTNEEGKAVLSAPKGEYEIKITNLPAGYSIEDSLTTDEEGGNYKLIAKSSVIKDSIPYGTKYSLGSVMYDFTVTTYDNAETYTLSTLLEEKKAVVLNFWASFCSPCAEEFPVIEEVYTNFEDKLEFLALNPYTLDGTTEIYNFLYNDKAQPNVADTPLSFPFAKDTAEIFNRLNIPDEKKGYPTTIVIDRYGVLAFMEVGTNVSASSWENLFQKFVADDYAQDFVPGGGVEDGGSGTLLEKPDVSMPDSSIIEGALNGENVDFTYYADKSEYSWPWLASEDGKSVYPANQYDAKNDKKHHNSFAILMSDITLNKGDVLAFDYVISTESSTAGSDYLSVIIDQAVVTQLAGNISGTQYIYVEEEGANHTLSFIYLKDSDDSMSTGDITDTISISNLRVTTEAELADKDVTILKAAARAYNAETKIFDVYSTVVYNEQDGFYHVGDKNGPYLLANLITATNWDSKTIIAHAVDPEKEYFPNGAYDEIMYYCQVANSTVGATYSTVDANLARLLQNFVKANSKYSTENPNEWLEFCYYYAPYGTSDGVENPVKGLTPEAAFEAELGKQNFVDMESRVIISAYNHVIFKFSPTQSGAYRFFQTATDEHIDGEAFLLDENTVYTFLTDPTSNPLAFSNDEQIPATGAVDVHFNFYYYLEAGKTYYIVTGLHYRGEMDTFTFEIERVGDSYYEWAPGSGDENGFFYTYDLETSHLIILGQKVQLNTQDGYYHVVNKDGSLGSIVWMDFTQTSGFTLTTLEEMIEKGAFDKITIPAMKDGKYYTEQATDDNGNPLYYDVDGNVIYRDKDGSYFYLDSNEPYFVTEDTPLGAQVLATAIERNADGTPKFDNHTAKMQELLAEAKKTNGYLRATKELADILNQYLVASDSDFAFRTVNAEQAWTLFGTYYYEAYVAEGVTPTYPTEAKEIDKTPSGKED